MWCLLCRALFDVQILRTSHVSCWRLYSDGAIEDRVRYTELRVAEKKSGLFNVLYQLESSHASTGAVPKGGT